MTTWRTYVVPFLGEGKAMNPVNPINSDVASTASALFARMAEIINKPDDEKEPAPVPRDWIWTYLPDEIAGRLAAWRDMFVKAMPLARPVDNLHITLFHELLDFEGDFGTIVSTIGNATPALATLAGLKAFRTEKDGIAIVIEVNSPDLCDLRYELQFRIQHTPSNHAKYTPHVTLAYIPEGEGIALEGLQLHGICGQQFIIDTVNAGTYESNQPCAMMSAKQFRYHGPTPNPFSPPDAFELENVETFKSIGMSTLDGESGGLLMQAAIEDPDDDDFDDDLDDLDDYDDQWLSRAHEVAESLDEVFGDY